VPFPPIALGARADNKPFGIFNFLSLNVLLAAVKGSQSRYEPCKDIDLRWSKAPGFGPLTPQSTP